MFGCTPQAETNTNDYNRPHAPWVFRSVLDAQARMITVALDDHLWAAYNTQNSALYKVWKGGVNFDGAVYTTVHGPQPSSLGDAWFENKFPKPWILIKDGQMTDAVSQYKGHRFDNGQVTLNYELSTANGQTIKVQERPEAVTNEQGQTGFERTFTISGAPAGISVGLKTNIGSIAFENSIVTEGGTFEVNNKNPKVVGTINALEYDGILKLNSSGETAFSTYFINKPLYENPNKVVGAEEEEERPLGYRLIARSDCKTCHNTYLKTIGPSYMDVAKKYLNNEGNIEMLKGKILKGGAGVWGETPMTAHADADTADIGEMVRYIMSLDAEEEAKIAAMAKDENAKKIDYKTSISTDKEDDLLPGILVRFFQSDTPLNVLADVDFKQKARFEGIIPTIQAKDADLNFAEAHFALEMTGYIRIPKDNNYLFRMISDDGSKLWINDELIIDHDGLHGADARDGEMALKAGIHPIKVEYFQGLGGKNIVLQWASFDNQQFEVIPATSLFHHKTKQAPDSKSATLALADPRKIPGDGHAVATMHPSYDLTQARPAEFTPKVGGMDFLPDGRLVISTWDAEGAVYILDNVASKDPEKITYKKIAKGLAEPLGLKVVDGDIYVLQKQELTRLIDEDGDDMIDEYRTIANSWKTSANFHEFAFGLAYKEGHFYANLAIAIEPGGASTQPQIPDRGKTMKINKETGKIEFVTHGLRTPNGIGVGVDNELFVSDNQGDWLPANKIMHVQQDAFYNNRVVDFEGTANLKVTPPVVWLPQDEIGNSPSTPSYLNDGPYKGQMIHGEVTHGGVKRVFVENINGEYQGTVFRFIQGLEAGVNRLVWGPDGALYTGGIGSTGNWGHSGTLWYGLQRMKYNGNSTFEMLAVRAKSDGLEIEFTEALPEGTGWNPSDYQIQQWWYLPTKDYGGPKMDKESLKVLSANVSPNRKKVFLELEGMKAGHVVYVRLPNHWVSEGYNSLWSTETWYTMNQIPENLPGTKTTAPPPLANNTLTEAEKAVGWELLFDGKTLDGWHNFNKETIGSSWKIQDEAIMLDVVARDDGGWQAKDGGDIVSADEYKNFDLRLEWKIAPCGNSGIMYNVVASADYGYVWQTGPEMQVLDNTCHPDAKYPTHRAGDLYDMIETKYITVRPAGQWNQIRILSKNGQVEHWQNGHKVVEFEMHTDEWTDMIANSKFKDMKGFGLAKKGHISLQDHGDRVWYRNIKIKKF